MIFFSKRKKLEEKYYEWLEENKSIKNSTFNVITFLSELFDEDKVNKFLEKE